jgi:hypothetical protein
MSRTRAIDALVRRLAAAGADGSGALARSLDRVDVKASQADPADLRVECASAHTYLGSIEEAVGPPLGTA